MPRRRPCGCGRRAWHGLAPRKPARNVTATAMSITCTPANPVSRWLAASAWPAPSVPARALCAPRFTARRILQAEATAVGAADLNRGHVDGLEILPLPQHHLALLRQLQPGDKRRSTQRWSNGLVEGQINRLKTLKRAMYGRAGVKLLRARLVPFLY
jgi:hypothetical protein